MFSQICAINNVSILQEDLSGDAEAEFEIRLIRYVLPDRQSHTTSS
jgi:hypothetical protein